MNEVSVKESRIGIYVWLWSLLLLNLCLTIYVMPPSFIFSPKPIGFVDFMQHYNHADNFVNMFKSSWSTWCYNPKYMAGFPDFTIFDLDNKFVEWFALVGSIYAIKPAISMKILLFLELFIEPFFIYFAFLNFRFRKKACLWACLGGILILNGPAGLFFNAGGMFSFIFAVFLSFFIVSRYFKRLILNDEDSAWGTVGLTALAPIFHSTSLFMIGIPVIFFIILKHRKINSRQWVFIVWNIVVTFLVNLYWIIPLLKTFQYNIANDYAWTGSFSLIQFAAMWIGANILTMGGLFAILYFRRGCKVLKKDQKELMSLAVFMAILSVLVGGPLWYLTRSLQPNRFLMVLQLYLLVPVIALLEQMFIVKSIPVRKIVIALLIVSLTLPGVGIAFLRFAPPGD